MPEAWSRREHLYLTPFLDSRTRFYSEADRTVIETIQCGVLFVMAFWSGPARQAFAELSAFWRRLIQAAVWSWSSLIRTAARTYTSCPSSPMSWLDSPRGSPVLAKPRGFATGALS